MPECGDLGFVLGRFLTLPWPSVPGSPGILPPGRGDALPVEALRDLLGIVRSLYAAGLENKGHPIELETLRHIGTELASALTLATTCEPMSLGHVSAWNRAERATKMLCELVAESMPLRPLLDTAVARAMTPVKEPTPGGPTRDEKRDARRRRG